MPKICYVEKKFQASSLDVIKKANIIIAEFHKSGFMPTLRSLYYKFVARDWFPDDRTWTWTGSKWVRDANGTKNAEPNYKWLGEIVNDGRLAGLIDWNAIEDMTRNLMGNNHWNSPAGIVEACAHQYRVDRWDNQDFRPEVWVEKDAVVNAVKRICSQLDVPYFSCRGYVSQSEMWAAGRRLQQHIENGQKPVIIHLGDHDPSGIQMSEDIANRLSMFSENRIRVNRVALNMDQVKKYNPPPNPAKLTDSRSNAYVEEFGDESWELDALSPEIMEELVRDAVLEVRDEDMWEETGRAQDKGRGELKQVAEKWDELELG